MLARYTILTVDEDAFTQALAAAGASREARSWTLGLNWYPNPWIKWYVTLERTVFEDGVPPARPAENHRLPAVSARILIAGTGPRALSRSENSDR